MDAGFLTFIGVMVSIGLAVSIPFGAVALFKALASREERKPGSGEQLIISDALKELDELRVRVAELEQV